MRASALAATFILFALLPAETRAGPPEPVVLSGYAGDAMEPFVSRDGRVLFFNTRNAPGTNTDIHYAEAFEGTFAHRGVLTGTTSSDLDATPTMSAAGRFCFISPREYRRTLNTVFCGTFDGKEVTAVVPQAGLTTERLGRLIFDVEIAADGNSMIFAEGSFSGSDVPDDADLYLAMLGKDGFERADAGKRVLANVNTADLEYAPALSANGRDLYFTRLTGVWPFRTPALFHARRANANGVFSAPKRLDAIEGFVEGPTLAPDGTLYFHKRVGDAFKIWRMTR